MMMELFLNTAITLSFFSTVAALIWLVWEQREIVSVFLTVWLSWLLWIVAKEL